MPRQACDPLRLSALHLWQADTVAMLNTREIATNEGDTPMLLTRGKSYIWIFWAFFVVWVVLICGLAVFRASIKLVMPLLPLSMLFVLVSEIRSRVALDSLCVATYPAGSPMYRILIAWHILGFAGLTALVVVIFVAV